MRRKENYVHITYLKDNKLREYICAFKSPLILFDDYLEIEDKGANPIPKIVLSFNQIVGVNMQLSRVSLITELEKHFEVSEGVQGNEQCDNELEVPTLQETIAYFTSNGIISLQDAQKAHKNAFNTDLIL